MADVAGGRFLDLTKIPPINLAGQYVGSRGPLPIPPSEQGQPVIASAGGGENGLVLAGRYASVAIGSSTYDFATTRTERDLYRRAASSAGRDPDELKYFTGFMPIMGATVEDAIGKRMAMDEHLAPQRVPMLGMMLGIALDASDIDRPLTTTQLDALRAHPGDLRSGHAVEIARQGWTPREILAHGVIDYAPSPVGPPEAIADYLTRAFEAGIADGFWLQQPTYASVDEFVDEVVPILRQRGQYAEDYEGATLREHLGVPRQYGGTPGCAERVGPRSPSHCRQLPLGLLWHPTPEYTVFRIRDHRGGPPLPTMTVRMNQHDAELVRKFASFEGVTISDFARAAILEKIEDAYDLEELREAIAHDSGERFSIDEILDDLA